MTVLKIIGKSLGWVTKNADICTHIFNYINN